MRNRRLAASLVAASAVAALIPTLAPATASAADRTGEQYAAAKLKWKRCAPDLPANFQCTTLKVPLDYSRPNGTKIDVAISRIKASSPAQRRGVLLLNPGGPGGEGLHMPPYLAEQLPKSVTSRYDLIGFDPRGLGQSSPVTCGLKPSEEEFGRPYKAATFSNDVRWARTVADKCRSKVGAKLPHLNTRNTARDMDAVRAALGEKKISYLGYSYGTYLGAVYAQMFPTRADRFVLDSAVDPQRVWRGMIQVWAEGTEPAFDRWTQWTAKRDATYKLGKTPSAVRTTFWNLVKRADRKPIVIDGQKINGDDIRSGARELFFSVRDGADAIAELKKAADGKSKPRLARLPGITKPATPPTFGVKVAADNGTALFWSILCADTRNWSHDPETYRRDAIRDKAKYPIYGDFASNITPCAFWGKGSEPATKVNNKVPTLILQNQWDSQTPLVSGVGAHKALKGSRMVTVSGGEGHGIYGSGSCADKTATAYLTTGKLPAKDLTCKAPEPKLQKSVRLPAPANQLASN
ncbi:alpha/beta hydrolase [Streptomyces sp. NPDC057702]|uniref:alpha/beta hydrolase n=1 Tax=unclassified Streptomyces TaxID=2593676 RepID=UPI0036A09C2E